MSQSHDEVIQRKGRPYRMTGASLKMGGVQTQKHTRRRPYDTGWISELHSLSQEQRWLATARR